MRNKKLLCIVAVIIICLAGLTVKGCEVKKSFADDTDVRKYLESADLSFVSNPYPYSTKNDAFADYNDIKGYEDLDRVSPVIIKAHTEAGLKRQIYYQCVLSQASVDEVYKGNTLCEGDIIDIFEPFNLSSEHKIVSDDGYNLMNDEEEYILFLLPLKDSNYSKQKTVYCMSATVMSKYSCQSAGFRLYDDEEIETGTYDYSDIKNEDVFISDIEDFKIYNSIRKTLTDNDML